MIATAEQLRYELAERNLSPFIKFGWRYIDPAKYVSNWHIDAISEHLEGVALGHITRLAIMMPPRHMKSLSVNVAFPAWVWAQKKRSPLTGPGVAFLSASYAQSLSVRDNVKGRRLIESPWYKRGWGERFRLTSDQNTKIRFDNDQGGYRIASSVDGSSTGEGGDIVIIDDSISANNALSPTIRAGANEWFDNTMTTRLNDPKTGAYILVQQRLHEDDLIGHLLAQQRDDWTVLCLPARYEPDHPFVFLKDPRTEPGQLLWPARMGEPEVKKLETALGSYGAAGQLQQRPAPREGGMFKRQWFEVVPAAPLGLEEVRAWDLAGTVPEVGNEPDWTSGTKIGRDADGFFYVTDVQRFRNTPHVVEGAIKNTASQDGKTCRIRVPQDPGQAGKSQAGRLVRMLGGYAVRAVPPTGSKETRATPLAAQAEAGNVKILKADWNEAFFAELENFPFGKHDDQVDSTADAFNELFDAVGAAGFLSMVRADNHAVVLAAAEAEAEAEAAAEEADVCPHPPGSMEYLRWHGLVPEQP
jgi:predicted phage terminase large subunit-like protein